MTRGGKVLFSFIALVLGTFLFTVFVHYQFVYSLNIRFIKPEEYPLIGNYMPFYFYWGSVIGMAILALVILWIILRPTEVTSIKLSEDKGKLEIKKSAIVGLIQSQVSQTNLLNDSKVKVKMYKRKIKVRIKIRLVQILIKPERNELCNERGDIVKELLMVYKYPIIGGLTGLICAILFFTVGFFKTILVLLMVGVGIFIGNYISKNDFIRNIFQNKLK